MKGFYRFPMSIQSSRYLTLRYCIYQILYYMSSSGIFAFAATYLLAKGFSTTQAGLILALGNLASCAGQPLLGSFLDKRKKFLYPKVIALLYTVAFVSLMLIQFANPPMLVFGMLYGLVAFSMSLTVAANNPMCVYYTERGCSVNYSLGIGIGSLSYSFGSLGFGFLIAQAGPDWMIRMASVLMALAIITVLGYRPVQRAVVQKTEIVSDQEKTLSLPVFFAKYRWFVFVVFGVALVAMCHSMAENFLINIFDSVGGGSSNVGVALFIACLTAAPIQLLFERVQKKINVSVLMKIAAVCYVLKAFLLIFAAGVGQVYLIELLQTVTYALLYPSLFYFAGKVIASQDKAKGQAVVNSFFMLGSAAGSLVGGRSIDALGLHAMLFVAMMLALSGLIIITAASKKLKNISVSSEEK